MSHKANQWLSTIPAERMTNSEFRVLFHLCYCHNPSKGCFPTQDYLRLKAGVSNGTLNNALRDLETKGLIARHRTWDNRTQRQRPTRYLLGFEMQDAGGSVPENGDGGRRREGSGIGDGADSNLNHDPTPVSPTSRLQPVGERIGKESVIKGGAVRSEAEKTDAAARFWAERIVGKRFVTGSAISAGVARRMIELELVEPGALRQAGVSW